jgi:hypothetical protein
MFLPVGHPSARKDYYGRVTRNDRWPAQGAREHQESGQMGESGAKPELARNCMRWSRKGSAGARSVKTTHHNRLCHPRHPCEPGYPARPYIAPERFVVQASSDCLRIGAACRSTIHQNRSSSRNGARNLQRPGHPTMAGFDQVSVLPYRRRRHGAVPDHGTEGGRP